MERVSRQWLAMADKYYRDYGCRAKEMKKDGKQIMGYLSALGPLEIITAGGFIPLRMKGGINEPITKADAKMETIICPFVRNVFDSALKGRYDYLDGMVIPHTCDSVSRTYDIWSYNLQLPYSHFLNVPHVTDEPSLKFFKEVLGTFIKSLEIFNGKKITDEGLAQAVKAYNKNRETMRQLYELRKSHPPLISGVEMIKVLVAAMSLPVEEATELICSVIDEVKNGGCTFVEKPVRIMIVGDQIDDTALPEIIEKAEAQMVMDDTSIGSQIYWPDIEITRNPIDGIAERYLRKIRLPTTYIDTGGTYQDNLEERFGHIRKFIKDFDVNGIILFIYRYCDPYGFEVPAMKDYINSFGTPVLYLEDEYSTSTLGRLTTRIEAFLEMIRNQ
jgi:benzoyl-CoA reductase/2-hydroxyglutaryl-CoA dehydratase subunit BcrC/BadD/HgdB